MSLFYKNKSNINEKELFRKFEEKKSSLEKEITIYAEYISFFKSYCNEDWSRKTPFFKEIESLSIYFSCAKVYKGVVPLKTPVKNIVFEHNKESILNNLREVFKEDFDTIQEMSLANILMLLADLKSYNESDTNEKPPKEFYDWRLEFYKSLKNNTNESDYRGRSTKVLEK